MDSRTALIEAADIAAKQTGNVPAAARVHFQKGTAVAWDGAMSVQFYLDEEVDKPFAVDAAFAGKMAKKMETFTIEVSGAAVSFQSGDLNVHMHRHDAEAQPHPKGVSIGTIKAIDLGALLKTAASFCSEGTPLTGNVFILDGLMCATDSVALAALPMPDIKGVALPLKAATKLAKLLLKDKDGFLLLDIQRVDSPQPEERGYRIDCSEFSIFVLSDAELHFPAPGSFFDKPTNYTITLPEMLADLVKALPDNEPLRIQSQPDLVTVEAMNAKLGFSIEVLGSQDSCPLDCLAGHIKLLYDAVGGDLVLELTDSNTNVRCEGKFVLAPLA